MSTTGRRVFFSVHYERDVWRATNVRNAGQVDPVAAAGWEDASLWEKAKRKGDAEIKRLIDAGLQRTSVTAVLIGAETADRPWIAYEIEKSIDRGNGVLGIRVHRIRDQRGRRDHRGTVPAALRNGGFRVYDWNRANMGRWVEWAAVAAGKECLKHKKPRCFKCSRHWWS
jgi:hypothetical protein